MDVSSHETADEEHERHPHSTLTETEPLLARRLSNISQTSSLPKQLTTRHAFAILITLQIGSGVFASPAQIDSNVPSPGASLLVFANKTDVEGCMDGAEILEVGHLTA